MQDKKFKSKVYTSDVSQITGNTIGEEIERKIHYIVHKSLENPPHIHFLTKNQLLWGGTPFKDLPDGNPIKIGLVNKYGGEKHLPIRMPSVPEMEKMERTFGLVLPWPPLGIFDVIQEKFREVENQLMDEEEFQEIEMAPCKGYIDKNGYLIDPAWNKQEVWLAQKISGYLFYVTSQNKEKFEIIQNYIMEEAPIQMYRIVERTKYTARKVRESRALSASSQIANATKRIEGIKHLNKLPSKEKIEDWTPYLKS